MEGIPNDDLAGPATPAAGPAGTLDPDACLLEASMTLMAAKGTDSAVRPAPGETWR